MKVALIGNTRGAALYTMATLRTAMQASGVIETDIGNADAVWVSICDVTELPTLKRARKLAGKRPLIMGGFEAWIWRPYLAWADAVVVGEGWEFIEKWGQDPSAALSLPCVATRDKAPTPSTLVRWDLCPLVCVPGHRRYQYLAARGCRRNCPFCLTGNCQPYQPNEPARLEEVARVVRARKSRLTWVTNDSHGLPVAPVDVHSVCADDYMAHPDMYKAGLVRIGIEGWTEDCRRRLGKPLSDADLRGLVDALKVHRQPAELYLMADYPGWQFGMVDVLASAIGEDADCSPPLFLKITYFDPLPGTPMGDACISGQWCDTRAVFERIGRVNRRVRVFGTRSRARSAWRTLLHRCDVETAGCVPDEPTDVNTTDSFGRFVTGLARNLRGLIAD